MRRAQCCYRLCIFFLPISARLLRSVSFGSSPAASGPAVASSAAGRPPSGSVYSVPGDPDFGCRVICCLLFARTKRHAITGPTTFLAKGSSQSSRLLRTAGPRARSAVAASAPGNSCASAGGQLSFRPGLPAGRSHRPGLQSNAAHSKHRFRRTQGVLACDKQASGRARYQSNSNKEEMVEPSGFLPCVRISSMVSNCC